jgi:hypothetical protein
MEAFFSTVKTELGDRFETGDEATRALFEYVEAFYNSALAPFNGRLRESGCLRATSAIDADERTITCDDKTIARSMRRKTAQDAPGTIFSRGGYSGIPPFSSTRSSKASFVPSDVIDNFPSDEDDVDAATPVDAQNAPTGVWKSRREREIPTAPTSIHVLLERRREKKKNEEQISSNQLSTKSAQIRSTVRCMSNHFNW